MCTATWLIRRGGFELFFNRDESRGRGAATGPRVFEVGGVTAIAPVDSDAGGTWIGVNEHGLALGLLNAWNIGGGDRRAEEFRSRGLLVADVLGACSVDDARQRVRALELGSYRGFRLVALAPDQIPCLLAWDGRELLEAEPSMPLSSSSFDADGAHRARLAALQSGAELPRESARASASRSLGAESLHAFHRSHAPERGPLSPCMHRSDARTVSSSHLVVDAAHVRFTYAPGPPCRTKFEEPVAVPRHSAR